MPARNFAKAMPSFARIGLAKSLSWWGWREFAKSHPDKSGIATAKRYWKRGEVTEISA